jgi:Putative Flp pilus-assembly TadE/G-like
MLSMPRERGRSDSRRSPRGEDGQVLPLMIALIVLILLAGMIVFWIGFSTSQAATAQTAADAAALAAEQSAANQVETSVTGVDWGVACQQADHYAEANGAHVLSCGPASGPITSYVQDAIVQVESNSSMPAGTPDSGHSATATARASTDPFSQASPAIKTSVSYTCDASLVSGPVFTAHSGSSGFFPAAGTDYAYGCEPKLAGALDALAGAKGLRLQGTSGYVAQTAADVTAPAAVAHGCGDASTTSGLESASDSVLKQYGLTRPFPGQRDVVELAGVSCDQQSGSIDAGAGGPVGLGNMNVHLVPLAGGPVGQLGFLGGGGISIGESPLQVGCQIYSVWQGVHATKGIPIGGLLVALMVAQDESDMGQNVGYNRTDPNQSVGVFQQISSDGWGTIPEEWDVTTAAAMFFEGGHIGDQSSTEGLIDYYQPGVAPWVLAQDVQRSGAGQDSDGAANYGASGNVAAAQTMLGEVTSGQCKTA